MHIILFYDMIQLLLIEHLLHEHSFSLRLGHRAGLMAEVELLR